MSKNKKNTKVKAGKSSGNKPNVTFVLIFIVDIITAVAFTWSIYFDLAYGGLDGYSIETLTFDSLFSVIAIVSSFFIPRRDEQILEKYHLTETEYNSLSEEPKRSATYINLFFASIILIIMDAFLFVYKMNWSLITALVVELMYICVFVGLPLIEYIRGDNRIIRLAIRKFLNIFYYDDKVGRNVTEFPFIVYPIQESRNDEINELTKIFGAILANNDVKFVYDKIYKSLHVKNDKSKSKMASWNLYSYFCNAIKKYINNDRISEEQYWKDNSEVKTLISNVFYIQKQMTNLSSGLDDDPYYYCSHSLSVLGSNSSYYGDSSNVQKLMLGINDILFDHYLFDTPSSVFIKTPNLIVLNYILFQTIVNNETWYIKQIRYYLHETKMSNYNSNLYLGFIVFVICFLITTKGKNKNYKERIKTLSNIIFESYSGLFYDFYYKLSPSEYIAFLHYLKNCSSNFEQCKDINSYDIFENGSATLSKWADDFWCFLVLIKSSIECSFFTKLESYLTTDEKNKLYSICNLCLEDNAYYKNTSESILKIALGGNVDITKNDLKKAINFVLKCKEGDQKEKDEISSSNIQSNICEVNDKIKEESNYVNLEDFSYNKSNIVKYQMQIVYCLNHDENFYLASLCNFLNSDFIIKNTFDSFSMYFDDKQQGMNIANVDDENILKKVSNFRPKYYYVSKVYEQDFKDSLLNDFVSSLERTSKYIEQTLNRSVIFYKDDAIHFYIHIDDKNVKMRPLLDNEISQLLNYFIENVEDFKSDLNFLDDVSKYVRVVTLQVDYDILLDFDKILICDLPTKK